MTTHIESADFHRAPRDSSVVPETGSLQWLVPIGRVLFALVFVLAALGNFSAGTAAYAASHGVPMAGILVPLAGVIALVGGLSVALGFEARYGAALLVIFLVPVTLMMHRFWGIADPQLAMVQRVMFLKNLSMLGGALLLVYFGAGPFSIDRRNRRRASP
jgi:putative oxidoreductase